MTGDGIGAQEMEAGAQAVEAGAYVVKIVSLGMNTGLFKRVYWCGCRGAGGRARENLKRKREPPMKNLSGYGKAVAAPTTETE